MTHADLDRYIHEELNPNWFPFNPGDEQDYLSSRQVHKSGMPFWAPAAFRWNQPYEKLLIIPHPQTPAPPHDHTFFEIMYVYEGEVVHCIGGQRLPLPAGSALIIPPGVWHSIEPSPEAISFNLILPQEVVPGSLLDRIRQLPTLYHCFNDPAAFPEGLLLASPPDGQAAFYFEELLCQTYDPDSYAGQTIRLLLPLFLTELERASGSAAPQHSQRGIEDDLGRVLQYIDANYATATLAEAETRFGYTSGYISKALKKATGQSFSQLRQSRCILRAATLLRAEPSRSVTSIADEVGIGNITQFYRLFDQQFHMTPKAYRAEQA